LVRNLDKERNALAEKVRKLDQQDSELKQLLSQYKQLSTDLESRKKHILEKAKEDARRLLQETNREIEKTIRHIRENQAQKSETLRVRKNLQEISRKLTQERVGQANIVQGPIKEGDHVRLIGQDGSGVVLSVKGKSAIVQLGELKSKIDLSKLEKTTISQKEISMMRKPRSTGMNLHDKRSIYNNTLDVRGKRVEEVVPMLDQFLDTSVLLGEAEVKILHGKGEGVLRKVIREQLHKYKQVASFSDEHADRGGEGITVVVLK
jgi:DNA mismatch repair protein MutS2